MGDFVMYTLMDGPSCTGVYRFDIRHGPVLEMDVQMQIFARADLTHVGIGPLTSMFLFDETMRVEHLERIVKKYAAIIDPTLARDCNKVVPKHFGPHRLNLGHLGEKPVSADIKAISVVTFCSGDPADKI